GGVAAYAHRREDLAALVAQGRSVDAEMAKRGAGQVHGEVDVAHLLTSERALRRRTGWIDGRFAVRSVHAEAGDVSTRPQHLVRAVAACGGVRQQQLA